LIKKSIVLEQEVFEKYKPKLIQMCERFIQIILTKIRYKIVETLKKVSKQRELVVLIFHYQQLKQIKVSELKQKVMLVLQQD